MCGVVWELLRLRTVITNWNHFHEHLVHVEAAVGEKIGGGGAGKTDEVSGDSRIAKFSAPSAAVFASSSEGSVGARFQKARLANADFGKAVTTALQVRKLLPLPLPPSHRTPPHAPLLIST